ncbi:DNA polymerase III subunit delta' [Alteromonas sediminis]|nr:DNA polymerase III subunit delta' [Alteromonas sediminis]
MRRAHDENLHHALLLAGPEGIGKQELAHDIGQGLLCQSPSIQGACNQCSACDLFNAGSHSDFYLVESEKQIGVDAIRSVISALSKTAQHGSRKVCIIRAAHSMTESAANALLKTLEEPTKNTYLVLIVDEIHQILPTILSRCEKWSLRSPEPEQAISWLQSYYPDKGPFDVNLVRAYGGAPLRLVKALEQENDKVFSRFDSDLNDVITGNKTSLKMAQEWQDSGNRLINWCQMKCLKAYRNNTRQDILRAYQLCIEAATRMTHPGVNKVLVLVDVIHNVSHAVKQK